MRVWYQSLFDSGRIPAYFEGLAARARVVARPGVEVEFFGMPEGSYGGRGYTHARPSRDRIEQARRVHSRAPVAPPDKKR